MNKKDIQNEESLEKLLDNKLIIGTKESARKVCNIILYILLFVVLLIFIVLLVSKQLAAIIFFIMLGIIFLILDYSNKKIIIDNLKISKVFLFGRKKQVGSMSEITSISDDIYRVTVLKDNKKLFSFNIHGRDDNLHLYNYLKSKYNHSIRIIGNKIVGISYCAFGMLNIVMFLAYLNKRNITLENVILLIMGLIFVFCGINECIKKFQIIDDKIIYKKLFVNKIYNISDLTKIEYEKSYYYRNIYNLHTIVAYINKKKVFIVKGFTLEKINLLKEMIRKYNSECKIKKR